VLLDVANLTTAYRGLIAISDISIQVDSGEIVTVAGANGAGKIDIAEIHCRDGEAEIGIGQFPSASGSILSRRI